MKRHNVCSSKVTPYMVMSGTVGTGHNTFGALLCILFIAYSICINTGISSQDERHRKLFRARGSWGKLRYYTVHVVWEKSHSYGGTVKQEVLQVLPMPMKSTSLLLGHSKFASSNAVILHFIT